MDKKVKKVKSDGSTASYYELPLGAKELQHLIAYKNMNAQIGEIFRASYRYGEVEHSEKLRDINKILFYAQAEKERLLKYEVEVAPLPAAPAQATGELEITAEEEEELNRIAAKEKAKPVCTVCDLPIKGRVYYLGNEPRCKLHSGDLK